MSFETALGKRMKNCQVKSNHPGALPVLDFSRYFNFPGWNIPLNQSMYYNYPFYTFKGLYRHNNESIEPLNSKPIYPYIFTFIIIILILLVVF